MFETLNRKFSISARIGLIAACGAVPVGVLLIIFVNQGWKDVRFAERERGGVTYLARVWPNLVDAAAAPVSAPDAKADMPLHVAGDAAGLAAKALGKTINPEKVAAGVKLFRAVADGSNLSVDTDLDSYYAQDAATVELPKLLATSVAAANAKTPLDRALALQQMRDFAQASDEALRGAIEHDRTGHARLAMSAKAAALNMAERAIQDPAASGPQPWAKLQRSIDELEQADLAELDRMLHKRIDRLERLLAANLGFVLATLALCSYLMIATARGLTSRLDALLGVMDRLRSMDADVDVPFLADTNETGRIAATLVAFRAGLIEISEARRVAERESQRAEAACAALSESEEMYRMLAEHVSDVIFRYDLEGVVHYVSPSIRQFGYEPEDVVGRVIGEFRVAEDIPVTTLERLRRNEPLPAGRGNEFRFRHRDGHLIWVQGNPAAIRGPDGVPLAVVTVVRNVSERREMEDDLRRRSLEAEAAVVAKAEFLANMSHEIRTPLTAVIGFAGLLTKAEGLPDRLRLYADRIARSGEALHAIVDSVLDFSKIEAGEMELKPQSFSPRELVEDTQDQLLDRSTQKGLTFVVETEAMLPDLVVADRGRLGQVLTNLLANAIKFTNAGGVTMRIGYDLTAQSLKVAVSDTGIGIPEERSNRLFERFSQIDGSNTRQFGGVGLGLAISKGLVEAMGGEMNVRSQEGVGSTFQFSILAPVASQSTEIAIEADKGQELPPLRILVVDDVAVNRELVGAMLEPFDLQLRYAADGLEAVDTADRETFDLILMDLQMPRMDGIAATQAIRDRSQLNRTTPILALSANILPEHIEACQRAGMNDHVGKPINPADLLSKIDRWTLPVESEGY